MRLTSATPARLVAVESQAAKHAEVHEMAMQDNVMKMRQVSGIDLPAGQAVELKPGGYHIMLLDLPGQIKEGDRVALTLVVEDDKHQQRRVPVNAVRWAPPRPAMAPRRRAGQVGDRPRRCRSAP